MTGVIGREMRGFYSATMMTDRIALIGIAAALGVSACTSKPAAGNGSLTPPFLEVSVPDRPVASAETVEHGKHLYESNCVQCHGAQGKGDGYGAPFLVPPPRDFTAAQFKFRTTSSGQLPTDADLFRIISRGADGTGMPPWKYLLTSRHVVGSSVTPLAG